MNRLAFALALLAGTSAFAAETSVDFTKETGRIRPELHSSGWTPRSYPRGIDNDDAAVKSMNFTYARTHDWALVNSGQRVIDYQYLFPLIGKDPKDPSNYLFGPTDHLLQLSRDVGLKTFYRLGTSIEHTGSKVHFNALIPEDFDKVAEVFAGIVRHYNRGWANGRKWDIRYWEIWNEPDGCNNMWCLPEGDEDWGAEMQPGGRGFRRRELFARFYVTCIKRLKSEFGDTIKVGGPALCGYKPDYFRTLFEACKAAGVAPDFISWHYYGANPDVMVDGAKAARALCDSYGFTKCELILNEWHYILTWDGIHGNNSTPAMVKRALDGPTGHNQIDSACFALTALEKIQFSKLDQAYYYGCSHNGNWGYLDNYKQFNKPYYAMKVFGQIVKDYSVLCGLKTDGTLTTMGVKSADGRKLAVLVTDYRGCDQVLKVAVKGAEKAKRVSTVVLDHTRDLFPIPTEWHDGELTLVKPDKNSAAFFVTFEM